MTRIMTICDVLILIVCAVAAVLIQAGMITCDGKNLAALIVVSVMIFTGIIAPHIPYNRHTGLRLPWTVQNEYAWDIAHKTLGMIAVPTGILYFVLSFRIQNFETLTLAAMIIWIGIPGFVSWLSVRA